jgi:hypothetical protein
MRLQFAAAGLLAAASLVAQSPLSTVMLGGNGLGAGSTIYFDLTVNVTATFTQIDVNSSSTIGTVGSIDVRTTPTTYVGNDTNAAAWTLQGSGPATSAGSGVPTPVTISPFSLAPGTYGVAITFNVIGQNYTNGNGTTVPGSGTNQTYSNAELTLLAGASAGGAPGTAICCQPRVFNGNLYYSVGSGTVATRNTYGTGCYTRFASFYENFATAPAFDLANSAISMVPSGGGYTVLPGLTSYVAPSGTATVLALTDDSETTVALSSPMPVPGGTTSALTVCSNGFVSVATGNGTGYTPTASVMLAAPQTGWWAWHDYNPAAVGSGAVKFEEVGNTAYVTWDGVYDYAGTTAANASTQQIQFDKATGMVHFVFGTMSTLGNGRLVGYSPGGASNDPGNRDISATLPASFSVSAPGVEGPGLGLAASARPVLGTGINIVTSNIPAGTALGATVLGLAQINPGLDLTFLGMPGCFQYINPSSTVVFVVGGPSASVPFNIPNVPAYVGIHVFAQSATFTSGLNSFGLISSNGLDLGIGNL